MNSRRWIVLVLGAAMLVGCQPGEAPPTNVAAPVASEPSFVEQLAQVKIGESYRIQVELSPVSDDDLRPLAEATKLRELLIDHPQSRITAAGLAHLAELPHFTHLRLRGTGVNDEALGEVAKLERLEILNVPQGEFTDEGLKSLQALPELVQFRFGSSRVTDEGMKTIAAYPALLRLHLIDVPITDRGLAELARIERLQSLYIDGSDLSRDALDELFRVRPKLHVHLNQQHADHDPQKHSHAH